MLKTRAVWLSTLLLAVSFLGGCASDLVDEDSEEASFELLSSSTQYTLVEGDPNGVSIPLSLLRDDGYDLPVEIEIRGLADADVAFITSSPTSVTLTADEFQSTLSLTLSIGDAPILSQTRDFLIVASDGADTNSLAISVSVQPTSAPDVYLLVGQSNMVGFSGDGTRNSEAGGPDEPNERVRQLNVSVNDEFTTFVNDADYTSESVNVVEPAIVEALDPLHIPYDIESGIKPGDYIGLGLSFGKRAIENTSVDVVLVPTAWSGSSFCTSTTPPGNWMAIESNNSNRGNTLLFDRAVVRANRALTETGGVLRGILWHQGESDATEACAPLYEQNLQYLAQGLRDQVAVVGDESLLRAETTIPFILGTMSRGVDDRDDLSVYSDSKQIIDDVHRNVASLIDDSAVSIHDDLTPAEGYPCGNTSCIHFGAAALRVMGSRYYDAWLSVIEQ